VVARLADTIAPSITTAVLNIVAVVPSANNRIDSVFKLLNNGALLAEVACVDHLSQERLALLESHR
jgi:hypothetical protein